MLITGWDCCTWSSDRYACSQCDTTSGGALCDARHEIYQGVIYLQNVIWFHGTRVSVISLTPIREVWPSVTSIFTKFVNVGTVFMFRSLIPNFAQIRQEMGEVVINVFDAIRENACHYGFSGNLQCLEIFCIEFHENHTNLVICT